VFLLFTVNLSIQFQAQIEPYRRSSTKLTVGDDAAVFTLLSINYQTRLNTVNLILTVVHFIVFGLSFHTRTRLSKGF
jgi:hypothetical protein